MTIPNHKEILTQILQDREHRFALRNALAERGFASISLNLNIPGFPKSSAAIQKAFNAVKDDLKRFLVAHRIHSIKDTQYILHSDSGDFFLQGVNYAFEDKQVKAFLEDFEQSHTLGRLLDVDLMNVKGEMISSGKAKKCLLCEQPAKECMKAGNHRFEEYRTYIEQLTTRYLAEKKRTLVISKIVEKALSAILYEVSVEDKPGLVCPSCNGAHTDMDFFTFLSSSAALSNYWRKTASYGYEMGLLDANNLDYNEIRIQLRLMGLEAEEAMFEATCGVNTQKGMIFLLGLACFASGAVFATDSKFLSKRFQIWVQKIMNGIVNEDFNKGYAQQGTHGEAAFKKYGKQLAGGARYEAEEGFPTVFGFALAYLKSQIKGDLESLRKEDWQEILTNLLMLIISKNNDVNILYRKNVEMLKEVQYKADKVLEASSKEEKSKLKKGFAEYCMLHNISPGGAADLLALTLFCFFMENLDFSALNYIRREEK